MIRIVALSDTHGLHGEIDVPDGDVLVHAGDVTARGDLDELPELDAWFAAMPHRVKVMIAGNHDWCFQREPEAARAAMPSVTYLEDSAFTALGLRFYGSPWQPRFFDWAFNLDRGAPLREKWDRIPAETDVLVTHGPPDGIGDRTEVGDEVGCMDLRGALARVRPRLHVFGHIHEGYGMYRFAGIDLVNASICNVRYRAVNAPVVVDLEP